MVQNWSQIKIPLIIHTFVIFKHWRQKHRGHSEQQTSSFRSPLSNFSLPDKNSIRHRYELCINNGCVWVQNRQICDCSSPPAASTAFHADVHPSIVGRWPQTQHSESFNVPWHGWIMELLLACRIFGLCFIDHAMRASEHDGSCGLAPAYESAFGKRCVRCPFWICTALAKTSKNKVRIYPLPLIRLVFECQVNCQSSDVGFCSNKIQQPNFVLWEPYCPEGVDDAYIIWKRVELMRKWFNVFTVFPNNFNSYRAWKLSFCTNLCRLVYLLVIE